MPLDELQDALREVLVEEKYTIQHRRLLQLDIHNCIQKYQKYALNEISILKRDQSSMVSVSVWIDGTFLNQYDADGLVIATPTGSTAYSMSAGGPILEPLSQCWVIVPIAPHSLTTRPLVIRDSCTIDIEVHSRQGRTHVGRGAPTRSYVLRHVAQQTHVGTRWTIPIRP